MKRLKKIFKINTIGISLIVIFILSNSCKNGSHKSCCSNISIDKEVEKRETITTISDSINLDDMAFIPGGSFMMGSDDQWARNDEKPVHEVLVDSFWIDKTEVTNRAFKKFVDATSYITTAERPFEIDGHQYPPGSLVFNKKNKVFNPLKWWQFIEQINWKHPYENAPPLDSILDHPAVHISFEDANAYAIWAGKRLPTEAEWEYAAGNGKAANRYPWGNDGVASSKLNANYWQGEFPFENKLIDEYAYTAPVKSFLPNSYGLYDMAGNVWEWCSDLYHYNYYNEFNETDLARNPKGPKTSYDPDEPNARKRVMKGGSFLCNDSYCSGYRVAARMKTSEETSLQHLGFRCVKSYN